VKKHIASILFSAASALAVFSAQAQTLPSGAPAGTTVECKDGSFGSPEAKSGACSGHKGIKTWFGKSESKAAAASPSAERQAGASKTNDAPMASKSGKASGSQDPASMTAAPGGGAGKVWVNSASKVYHCESDRYYGKTKRGEYMIEADAKAKGMRAAYKKTCGS
jgi:hypothetical protein